MTNFHIRNAFLLQFMLFYLRFVLTARKSRCEYRCQSFGSNSIHFAGLNPIATATELRNRHAKGEINAVDKLTVSFNNKDNGLVLFSRFFFIFERIFILMFLHICRVLFVL